MQHTLIHAGMLVYVCQSIEDVLRILKMEGVPLRRIRAGIIKDYPNGLYSTA